MHACPLFLCFGLTAVAALRSRVQHQAESAARVACEQMQSGQLNLQRTNVPPQHLSTLRLMKHEEKVSCMADSISSESAAACGLVPDSSHLI